MDDPLDGLEEIDVETVLNDLLSNELIAEIFNPHGREHENQGGDGGLGE